MHNMNKNLKEGDKVTIKNKEYTIVKETSKGACKGCYFINKGCYNNKEILNICRQGFIFKNKD